VTTKPAATPATASDSPVEYDVAVVGGGAAGLSAAVYTARYGLETLVLARGTSAIHQCAHIENYLRFPGGISPQRFLNLGRAHATREGATMADERVTAVNSDVEVGFTVRTTDREIVANRVVVAAAYDSDVLNPLAGELSDPDLFAPTEDGCTTIDGLYIAGWMSDETVHQAGVNAGHGACVGLALVRDDMSERYWPAVGERYVDWIVHDGRYGGDGWNEHVDEWFDGEMLPDERDRDEKTVQATREDLKAEFLGRCIDPEERRQRDREGQRQLLELLDGDLIREYAEPIEQP